MTQDEFIKRLTELEGDLDALEDESEAEDLYEVVEEGDWISVGKCEYQTTIILFLPTGKHFSLDWSRSGSYYSDYDYYFGGITKVKPKEVTIVSWVADKD